MRDRDGVIPRDDTPITAAEVGASGLGCLAILAFFGLLPFALALVAWCWGHAHALVQGALP